MDLDFVGFLGPFDGLKNRGLFAEALAGKQAVETLHLTGCLLPVVVVSRFCLLRQQFCKWTWPGYLPRVLLKYN